MPCLDFPSLGRVSFDSIDNNPIVGLVKRRGLRLHRRDVVLSKSRKNRFSSEQQPTVCTAHPTSHFGGISLSKNEEDGEPGKPDSQPLENGSLV